VAWAGAPDSGREEQQARLEEQVAAGPTARQNAGGKTTEAQQGQASGNICHSDSYFVQNQPTFYQNLVNVKEHTNKAPLPLLLSGKEDKAGSKVTLSLPHSPSEVNRDYKVMSPAPFAEGKQKCSRPFLLDF
jgi:hypothetical protein